MLGRTAASLFWLCRQIERSENLARLLDVGYRVAMLPSSGEGHREEWRSTLISAGCEEGFREKYDELTERAAINYMLFDMDNSGSIRCCLHAARNNAKAVRTALTSEMWESLNTTWLEFSELRAQNMTSNRLPEVLSWIKQRSMLFRGAMLGTMLRDDTYYFSQLGAFMERGDNTARILDVKYHLLLPDNEIVGGGVDRYQWSAILRSVSAHRSYRWVYGDKANQPWYVAEFMMLNQIMPRSLVHCYSWITESLLGIENLYQEKSQSAAVASDLFQKLRTSKMDDIFADGLHEFLTEFLVSQNGLSSQIAEDYHFY
ncbi:MAG: alpha-E domain-containing protein [Stappiaceae bacterium]